VFAERGFMSVNWTVASCSAGQESLTLTFADSGVVTTAAGVPTGQTCVASAAAITVTLKPGESRTVTSLEPQICPSQLTNPSVHTVSAVARAGIVVLTRATDTYVTLPPA
jgi:hypothetical protein